MSKGTREKESWPDGPGFLTINVFLGKVEGDVLVQVLNQSIDCSRGELSSLGADHNNWSERCSWLKESNL